MPVMPVIMTKIAMNGTYEQESDEGAANNCVSWPDCCLGICGHGALLLGQSGLSSRSYLGALLQYRARKQAVSRTGGRLLTRAAPSDLSRRGRE